MRQRLNYGAYTGPRTPFDSFFPFSWTKGTTSLNIQASQEGMSSWNSISTEWSEPTKTGIQLFTEGSRKLFFGLIKLPVWEGKDKSQTKPSIETSITTRFKLHTRSLEIHKFLIQTSPMHTTCEKTICGYYDRNRSDARCCFRSFCIFNWIWVFGSEILASSSPTLAHIPSLLSIPEPNIALNWMHCGIFSGWVDDLALLKGFSSARAIIANANKKAFYCGSSCEAEIDRSQIRCELTQCERYWKVVERSLIGGNSQGQKHLHEVITMKSS